MVILFFQNTGNDTAFLVRLVDMLPQELDKTTLKIGASSHPMTYSLKGNGVLEFLFTNIRLVDSTTNEAKSHGFVRYKIRTKPNLVAGQRIENQANIYFDANVPVLLKDNHLPTAMTINTGQSHHGRKMHGR